MQKSTTTALLPECFSDCDDNGENDFVPKVTGYLRTSAL